MVIEHGGNLFAICRERGWDWREVLDLSASIQPARSGARREAGHRSGAGTDHALSWPDSGRDGNGVGGRLARGLSPCSGGGGATELLHFVARAGWRGPVALATPVWSEFYRAFPHALRLSVHDPERWPQRGLLIISQPVNPTGEAAPEEIIRRTIATREGPVLIDETFIEFTRLESAIHWVKDHPNLLVLRSLSKFHGLPGLRVGALVGSDEWMSRLRSRREPWRVSTLAEAAARAALSDHEHAERTRELVASERQWLLDRLAPLPGLRLAQGVANYLFAGTERPARGICDWFLDRKILLRNCTGLPGVDGEAIRLAVRTRPENERFLAAAEELFCEP